MDLNIEDKDGMIKASIVSALSWEFDNPDANTYRQKDIALTMRHLDRDKYYEMIWYLIEEGVVSEDQKINEFELEY